MLQPIFRLIDFYRMWMTIWKISFISFLCLWLIHIFVLLSPSTNVSRSRKDILCLYLIVHNLRFYYRWKNQHTKLRISSDCIAFFITSDLLYFTHLSDLSRCQICEKRQAVKETFRIPDFILFQWKRKCEIATHYEDASHELRVNGKRQKREGTAEH